MKKKVKVYLWMNALLESKLLSPRKTMIYWQPNLFTSLESLSDSFCVFISVWYEMKCKG